MTVNLKNFLNPKVKLSKMGEFQELQPINGMEVSSISADLYGDGRDDLSLFYFPDGANFAALYTMSKITSASINWNLKIKRHFVKALLVNTKNANTFTGIKGAQGLKEIAHSLSKALTIKLSQSPKGASEIIKITDLLFASTGVIGEDFPYLKIKNRISELVKKLRAEQNKFVWFKVASAIMTTDTKPKLAYEECKIGNKLVKISGIAKGSGMIAPNMATMLSFIFTDANISSIFLRAILKKVAATTFNSITVDSDTSTNDMVAIFATGKAKNSKIYNVLDPKLQDFEKALHRLALNLSTQIIVDGEGAKKFITIKVIGARSMTMAKNIGFSIANSPLFKTAIAGEDPNWGRIVMGIGKSGENIIPNKVQIKIGDYLVAEQSRKAKVYNESNVKEYMKWDSINIEVNLNIGNASFTVYTCDFTSDYININADYRN
ncbi:MAG TPA: bifunctional glutamate N-acetyltransferase/amino-acid acetyltransferase ArgJ [Pelagibacteraceae bacterium]|jgi:glutamate N-acetyltransferase/amino-acid N-acetyltransferase|nr:bifunctional glutamate N-acetyltransferase/amino-acid acetyltransferase ArgJ [Pelagibacteraceae bacterium]